MSRILRPWSAPLRLVRRCACLRLTLSCTARRNVSSSANPFPYPTNVHPTPHQIFHLPPSASRDQVKARYYDLVRIYHPDSPISRAVPPETAHTRFQAISAAYAVLSGKAKANSTFGGGDGAEGPASMYHNLSTAMWRARQRRRAELHVSTVDDVWKDRAIFAMIVLTLGLFVVQTWTARQRAISEALARPKRHTRADSAVAASARRRLDDSLLAAPAPEELSQKES